MSLAFGKLKHGFRVPRLPRVVVIAPVVEQKLDSPGRLHVIRAARGFGKTTVGAWWATRAPDAAPLWIDIDPGDQASVLNARVTEALGSVGALDAEALSQRPVRLVLRHTERMETGELAGVLRNLLQKVSQVRVLALMRLSGPIVELRSIEYFGNEVTSRDLRFGPSQVQQWAKGLDLLTTPERADEIATQTHGWPAMVAAVLTGSVVGQEPDWEAGTYFFNRIFNDFYTQEQKVRDLVLSVSSGVTEAGAEYVLGDAYEPGYLARFGEDGECPLLPRPVGGEYRSSPFMRGAATKILAHDFPAVHHQVHMRLSQWQLQRREYREALWHAVLSGDHELISDVVQAFWGTFILSCPDLLNVAVERLRGSRFETEPLWRFLKNVESFSQSQHEARELLMSTVLKTPEAGRGIGEATTAEHYNRWGWTQVLYAKPSSALYAFWRAYDSTKMDTPINDEARIGLSMCLAQLGYTSWSRAWAISLERLRGPFLTAVFDLLSLIWIEDGGGPSEKESSSGGYSSEHIAFRARLEAFTTHLVEHLYHDAAGTFTESVVRGWLDRDIEQVLFPRFTTLDVWERDTLWSLGIEVPRVRTGTHPESVSDTTAWKQARLVRQHVMEGRYKGALQLSSRVPDEVRLLPRPWMSILLSRTIASHRLGHADGASEELHQAIAISQECSLVSPFFLITPHELREIATRVPQLFPMLENQVAVNARELLTPQQLLLLRELTTAAPLTVIARRLYLSPSTVKTHLAHIYKKLDASNRDQAVAQARRLRLLIRDI